MSKKNKTPKEYVFRFQGSKEEFLYLLDQKASGKQLRYMGNYMIELIDDEIHFGVERGGHSGGYWFVSKLNEIDSEVEFRGTIKYIGPEYKYRSKAAEVFDNIKIVFLCIIFSPIILVVGTASAINWCIRKIFKLPIKNTEYRLIDLMENHLNCKRIK